MFFIVLLNFWIGSLLVEGGTKNFWKGASYKNDIYNKLKKRKKDRGLGPHLSPSMYKTKIKEKRKGKKKAFTKTFSWYEWLQSKGMWNQKESTLNLMVQCFMSFKPSFWTTYTFRVRIFIKGFFRPETRSAFNSLHWTFSFPWSSLPAILVKVRQVHGCCTNLVPY